MEKDYDIKYMDRQRLQAEIIRLRECIRHHRDKNDDRSREDLALYDLLPDGKPFINMDQRELFLPASATE